jgi:hypothetical protein
MLTRRTKLAVVVFHSRLEQLLVVWWLWRRSLAVRLPLRAEAFFIMRLFPDGYFGRTVSRRAVAPSLGVAFVLSRRSRVVCLSCPCVWRETRRRRRRRRKRRGRGRGRTGRRMLSREPELLLLLLLRVLEGALTG